MYYLASANADFECVVKKCIKNNNTNFFKTTNISHYVKSFFNVK